jgi:hypothetical protein
MSCEELSPEELIARLSYQSRPILNGMISISKPAKRSAIQRDPSSSSLGLLDRIPLELLHLILVMLDFRSLLRVSRVSLLGQVVVQSLPAYRDLMEHAPHTLAALGQTGLIGLHTATVLHATLLSEICISCEEYGAFLFLPTCERCCYECLHRNQSLWVIPTALAGKCFDLMPHQLKEIPTMRSVPGVYSVGHRISRQRRLRLTSVKAAKELGTKVHVSMENIAKTPNASRGGKITEKELYMFQWLQNAPLQPLGRDPSMLPTKENTPSDDFCGMASVPFPSLMPNKELENGLWCRGCEQTFEHYRLGYLGYNAVSDSMPPGCDPLRVLLGMQRRARSKAEFLEHIKYCHGARELLPDLWLGRNQNAHNIA